MADNEHVAIRHYFQPSGAELLPVLLAGRRFLPGQLIARNILVAGRGPGSVRVAELRDPQRRRQASSEEPAQLTDIAHHSPATMIKPGCWTSPIMEGDHPNDTRSPSRSSETNRSGRADQMRTDPPSRVSQLIAR